MRTINTRLLNLTLLLATFMGLGLIVMLLLDEDLFLNFWQAWLTFSATGTSIIALTRAKQRNSGVKIFALLKYFISTSTIPSLILLKIHGTFPVCHVLAFWLVIQLLITYYFSNLNNNHDFRNWLDS